LDNDVFTSLFSALAGASALGTDLHLSRGSFPDAGTVTEASKAFYDNAFDHFTGDKRRSETAWATAPPRVWTCSFA
jgi:hypothetical protein